MEAFDVAMMLEFDDAFFHLPTYISKKHEADRVIVFERGPYLFIFNFHPTVSYPGYRVGYFNTGINNPLLLESVMTSDAAEFGGWGRIDPHVTYPCQGVPWDDRNDSLQVYLPCRTCIILKPVLVHC